MKISNITKGLLSTVALCAFLFSCSEDTMDSINQDRNHTTAPAVRSKYIVTNLMTSTAFGNVGGDFDAYLSIYIEHEIGTHNQFWNAEMRETEPTSASTFNNVWAATYKTLFDAQTVIEKCSNPEDPDAGNDVTLGVGQLFAAYNLALLTDMFGDTPWTEADYRISRTPKLDKQEDIYKDVFSLIDQAIANFQKSDISGMGTQDLVYGGDKAKWLKAAYALKARYTMRLLHKSSNVATDMQTVLDCVSKSFASASEQCSFAVYGGTQLSPKWSINSARGGLAASKSMYDKIVELGDPRIGRCFWNPSTDNIFASTQDEGWDVITNGGGAEGQLKYTLSTFIASTYAPTHFISYHEILFLKAEALYRLNRLEEAKAALKEAVVAGMANMEVNVKAAIDGLWGLSASTSAVTPEEAATYFDTKLAPLFDQEPLKTIMIQKYIAFWGANGESTETYNDVRRMKAMGTDFYGLQNPHNADGKFPLRTPYGNSDTTTNPNVEEAYGSGVNAGTYVYSENVWWAGGSR